MKKLISLVLILCMACMLIPAMAEDVTGEWYLVELSSGGMTLDPSMMGMSWSFTLNEDGTLESTMDQGGDPETAAGEWSLDGDALTLTIDGDPVTVTVADGKFAIQMGDEGSMVFSKDAPAAAEAAEAVAAESEDQFFGSWQLSALEMEGKRIGMELLSALGLGDFNITLNIESGKATIALAGSVAAEGSEEAAAAFQDGRLVVTEEETTVEITLMSDGSIAMPFDLGGQEAILYLTRVEAAEEPAA